MPEFKPGDRVSCDLDGCVYQGIVTAVIDESRLGVWFDGFGYPDVMSAADLILVERAEVGR